MICEWLQLSGSDCTNFWMSFWFSVAGVVLGAVIGAAISWWYGKKGKEDLDKALEGAAQQIVKNMEDGLDEAAEHLASKIPADTAKQVKVSSVLDALIASAPLLARAAIKYSEHSADPKKPDNAGGGGT